ncbi:PIG-L family deacetylase [Salinicola sp. MIT1003]|uniref:PIG-L family deacetylase n=1 Tax=Salinicola sp. MIT1003 TaxID=1882734 RepID=UPI001481431B|nr:PIG-L family deacetylase [Salinicola sp. MIT1003]
MVWLQIGEWHTSYAVTPLQGEVAISVPLSTDLLYQPLQLVVKHGSLASHAVKAILAPRPLLDDGNLLIVAPHPDDAEIAAGGLYTQLADHTHLVTLSAGERLNSLDRQYISALDAELDTAIIRKGEVRSWNSHATPRLSGIPAERNVLLGVPDGRAWDLVYHGSDLSPAYPISQARRFNTLTLPGDTAPTWQRASLIAALTVLIDRWQPTTLVVTDPEFDSHRDHQAAALAVAMALEASVVRPQRLLLYANHYRDIRQPPGPAFQPAWTPPRCLRRKVFASPQPCVIPLSLEEQRHKALLLDAMTDLSLRKPVSRRRRKLARFERAEDFALGRDRYFHWAVRSGEYFQQVSSRDFIQGLLARK